MLEKKMTKEEMQKKFNEATNRVPPHIDFWSRFGRTRRDKKTNEPMIEDAGLIKQCLEICKQCEWYRPEKLTAENSDASMPVRVVGNAIYSFFKKFGVEPFRCGKCGCFGSLKAKLLRGKGCPLGKWVNDKGSKV